MPRRIPAERFTELVRAATQVFIARGYRRTQMADIAEALGVAKGTLYLYVESKEALFLLCARHCDAVGDVPQPTELPVPHPVAGETLRVLEEKVARESGLPALERALTRSRVRDARLELEGILREIYATMRRNRNALELIDRCGQDHPELATSVQREVREFTQRRLARYLEARGSGRGLRPIGDAFLAARVAMETLTTWAVHIAWDPVPQSFDEKQTEDTVVAFVLNALLRDA